MSKKMIDFSSVLKQKIKNFNIKVVHEEEGTILSVADGIVIISGLSNVKNGELLEFSDKTNALVLDLNEDYVGALLFDPFSKVNVGDKVKRTNKVLEIPTGDELIGRVVNPFSQALDDGKEIKTNSSRKIEIVASGVMTRKSVSVPLKTGIISIDSMIPIGRGQRELIIGDRKTGKTAIAIDAIINQKNENVICVYVSIGQKNSTLVKTIQKLKEFGAMEYTTIVAANSSDADSLQYLAPYSGMAIAEEWMHKGKDVLIIFDDLTKHAVAYRTISLLLRRPPGREAYPGDVFYLHSRLLERSGRLNEKYGGGSITALPIIETQAGDISAYIPTNVISITDGQIFLMTDAFNSGQRPAVDAGLSVSRVGSAAQRKVMKAFSSKLKLMLANYSEVKSFAEFSSQLDGETKKILSNGQKIMEFLKQKQYLPENEKTQLVYLFITKGDLLEKINLENIPKLKEKILKELKSETELNKLITEINDTQVINEDLEKQLYDILSNLIK